MLKKWLNKVLSGRQSRQTEVRKEIIPAEEYRISADMISFAAEKTVKRLQEEGFKAYIVGGAVRDMLLGVEPKDFDVATDATPEEVRKIFRRSRIIGRRFQIVHVMTGPETIEVTTFRGGGKVKQHAKPRIIQDNHPFSIPPSGKRRKRTTPALY